MSRYFPQVFKLLILLPCLFWLIKRKINPETYWRAREDWKKKKITDIKICESFWESSAPAYLHWSFIYVCKARLSGNRPFVRSGCQPSAQQLPVPAQGSPGITATVTSHCLMLALTAAAGWERVHQVLTWETPSATRCHRPAEPSQRHREEQQGNGFSRWQIYYAAQVTRC